MATINGEIDQYGFERSEDFNYESYEAFMSEYLRVLARRMAKWEKFMKETDEISRSRKVKRYVRKGIPSELRREVWMNVSLAQQMKEESPNKYEELLAATTTDKRITDAIQGDIRRTYPENIYFKEIDDSLLKALGNVLTAYANYNTNIGYCQGLNYIAGMLLLIVKNEKDTFWLLVQLLDRFVPDFYSFRMFALRVELNVLDRLILLAHPDLHAHFKKNKIDLELLTSKWFVCLFMDVLPVETVLRLWDCLFYEGSKILLRTAYTLIIMNKDRFMATDDFTEFCKIFKDITNSDATLSCHNFLSQCFTIPKSFSRSKIKHLRKKVAETLKSSER